MKQTGTALLHYTKSTWLAQGRGTIVSQAQLRRIPESEGDYLNKNKKKISVSYLVDKILEFDAKNK
jgi:hypothetical protein